MISPAVWEAVLAVSWEGLGGGGGAGQGDRRGSCCGRSRRDGGVWALTLCRGDCGPHGPWWRPGEGVLWADESKTLLCPDHSDAA